MGTDLILPVRMGVLLFAFLLGMTTNHAVNKMRSWMTSMSHNQEKHYSQVDRLLLEDDILSINPNPTQLPLSPLRVQPPGYRFPASKTMKKAIARLKHQKKKTRNLNQAKVAIHKNRK